MIPYGQHWVDEQDIDAVVEVLRHQFLTQGAMVPKFEQVLCDYTQSQYAIAVNSATSGLHAACLAAELGQGDWLWTVPNSFVASANCGLYCGAKIDFVDINPSTRNLDVQALADKLSEANKLNCLPKVLVVVHFSGASCDMQAISALTQNYGIVVIEDAAHALGASYLGNKVGSCQFSDMTVLSFHPVKSITSAEGGAVLTNSSAFAEKLKLVAKHGVTRDPAQMQGDSHGPWYYQQIALGYNYRLSDVHAALGLSQLKKLDSFIQRRTELALRYQSLLSDLPLTLPVIDEHNPSAWHLYMVELKAHSRDKIYASLQAKGIGVNVHYIPIHLHPYYQELGFKKGDFAVSETFYQHALTLPLFPSMTNQQQDRVSHVLHEVLQ
ncbi:UDP-4-amino-4,6-dideoxy-N-acetyl-beta-L-altrosamine transaminase [Paraglaciecola aestuariivivens]